jgi:hypothetical protein
LIARFLRSSIKVEVKTTQGKSVKVNGSLEDVTTRDATTQVQEIVKSIMILEKQTRRCIKISRTSDVCGEPYKQR